MQLEHCLNDILPIAVSFALFSSSSWLKCSCYVPPEMNEFISWCAKPVETGSVASVFQRTSPIRQGFQSLPAVRNMNNMASMCSVANAFHSLASPGERGRMPSQGGVIMTIATSRIAQFLGLSEADLMHNALRSLLLEQRRNVLQVRLETLTRHRGLKSGGPRGKDH